MDRWLEAEVFAKIAEVGSVTAAAEALGLSVSATSRHLIALEERLKGTFGLSHDPNVTPYN